MAVERVPQTQVRQGDVLLTPISTVPYHEARERLSKDARNLLLTPEDGAVLARGQGGGHPHAVFGEDVLWLETNDSRVMRQQPGDQVSRIIVTGPKGATLEHDEHEPIELAPSTVYVVFRQLETLVGDENTHERSSTGVIANDQQQVQRRYVAD